VADPTDHRSIAVMRYRPMRAIDRWIDRQ